MPYLLPLKLLSSSIFVFAGAFLTTLLITSSGTKTKDIPGIVCIPLAILLVVTPIVIMVSIIWIIWSF